MFQQKILIPYTLSLLILVFCFTSIQGQSSLPVRVAVAGLSHGHSTWIFGKKYTTDIQVAGIYEPDRELAEVYRKRFNLDKALFYTDMQKMLDEVQPEGVMAFNPTSEHLAVVKACAPRGIHVMVEKPLATTVSDALKMEALAKKYNIHLLTNYETSWYPTTEKTYELIYDSSFVGEIKKVIFHTGHSGARNTETNKFFFRWLTDPVKNGGGAITDFGCYGANLMTYLTKGEHPVSVTVVTRQFKPEIYPRVDDEATIIISYPTSQCIIQASWNWPFNRKDMSVYGQSGYIIAENDTLLKIRNNEIRKEGIQRIGLNDVHVYDNPFSYFADVIRGKLKVPDYGPYSLENNLLVVHILEAARKSATKGKTFYFRN